MIECELDTLVAEKVMGIAMVRGHPVPDRDGNWEPVSCYITDPAADYAVLERVREKWNQWQLYDFGRELELLWRSRQDRVSGYMIYRPGDYSRAALRVLGLMEEPEPIA